MVVVAAAATAKIRKEQKMKTDDEGRRSLLSLSTVRQSRKRAPWVSFANLLGK